MNEINYVHVSECLHCGKELNQYACDCEDSQLKYYNYRHPREYDLKKMKTNSEKLNADK